MNLIELYAIQKMAYILHVEHHYAECYPDEHMNENHYKKIYFKTPEEAYDYVHDIYEKTKAFCSRPPKAPLLLDSCALYSYDYIPIEKRISDPSVPLRDIEMYGISIWFNTE